MQQLIVEIKRIKDKQKAVAFTVKQDRVEVHRYKGEKEYSICSDDLDAYWKAMMNGLSMCADDEVSVLLLTDDEKSRGILTELVTVIKNSGVKAVPKDRNTWKRNKLKEFFANKSELKRMRLKSIDVNEKTIALDENGAKHLHTIWFDSLVDVVVDTEKQPQPKPQIRAGGHGIRPSAPKPTRPSITPLPQAAVPTIPPSDSRILPFAPKSEVQKPITVSTVPPEPKSEDRDGQDLQEYWRSITANQCHGTNITLISKDSPECDNDD